MRTPFAALLFLCILSLQNLGQNSEAQKLHALFDTEWQWTLENYPTFGTYLGDKRFNSRWGDMSLSAIAARNQRSIQALEKLKQIDRSKLSVADKVNYDLFLDSYESSIASKPGSICFR